MTVYTNTANHTATVLMVAGIFTIINLPSIALWCGMGQGLRQFLADPARLKIFNVTMALLLIASLWPMLR
jgi:threonine/homoserine/homoserine lactone efflux protein